MLKSYVKNERGHILAITLFVIVFVTVLGFSIITMTSNTLKISTNERTDQAIYYIAEAGLVERKAALTIDIQNAYSAALEEYKRQLTNSSSQQSAVSFQTIFKQLLLAKVSTESATYTDFEKQFSQAPQASVNIKQEEQASQILYTITSTGILGESASTSRVVSQKIIVDLNSASANGGSSSGGGDYAVYARNKIVYGYYDIKNNVKGEIASANYDYIDTIQPGPKIPLLKDPDRFDTLLNGPYREHLQFPMDDFNNVKYDPNSSNLIKNNSLVYDGDWNKFYNATLPLTGNLKLTKFELTNGLTFTIDVGNSDKILYVDDLILKGRIDIKGSGKLTIFAKKSIVFDDTYINLDGSANNLAIFYAGNETLNITNNVHLKANLYVKKANLNYYGGGGFSGALYSNGVGKIEISGGAFNSAVHFIVPNYSVTITGGASVIGSIICDSLTLDGGASISGSGSPSGGGSISIESSNPIKQQPVVEQ